MDSDQSSLHISSGVSESEVSAKTPKRRSVLTLDDYVDGIRKSDRAVLGRVFSLLESSKKSDREIAEKVIERISAHTNHSIRLGVSGIPGVGKSTFIEAFGMHLVKEGHRVAVLAVDPSSERTGGSIMGDKTRMEELSLHEDAIVRPSPSGKQKGGVARGTRDSILVCEAAEFDVIIIETVGVGQSETMVASMVDFFLLLAIPNAGDELQGMKRGIIEMVDAIAVNKADGENVNAALLAQSQYQSALRLISKQDDDKSESVLTCSAITGDGIPNIWNMVSTRHEELTQSGELAKKRESQNLFWMHETIRTLLEERFNHDTAAKMELEKISKEVLSGKISPFAAAEKLITIHSENLSHKKSNKES